jgi:hypothetical protein
MVPQQKRQPGESLRTLNVTPGDTFQYGNERRPRRLTDSKHLHS